MANAEKSISPISEKYLRVMEVLVGGRSGPSGRAL